MLFTIVIVLVAEVVASVKPPERPVVPNITALSPTEVRITWCRVNSNKVEIDHYELFIDNELEYSGVDVMYTAKRLKSWSWYEVKLRACGISPCSCSPFSIPVLVKTLRDNDNSTMIQSGVTIFRVVVVPTYMFILGMLAGVIVLSLCLMWRYFQCADWSGELAFDLPQYFQSSERKVKGNFSSYNPVVKLISQDELLSSHSYGNTTTFLSKACQVDDIETNHFEIAKEEEPQEQDFNMSEIISHIPSSLNADILDPKTTTTNQFKEQVTAQQIAKGPANGNEFSLSKNQTFSFLPLKDDGHWDRKLGDNHIFRKETFVVSDNRDCSLPQIESRLSDKIQMVSPTEIPNDQCLESAVISETTAFSQSTCTTPYTKLSNTHTLQSCQTVTAEVEAASPEVPLPLVVAIDNSNIYIGAQECASMMNPSDRKRHVRVKLQNLVRILEKERVKLRGFACGSSPPATEHIWEVYRRLGYTVDLEDRRGKDEQRVDEGLHLCIYKALCELPAGVLVLATGDGMKGKSECDTSFPGCAISAVEQGWCVEVYSWKHSLSAEWNKLAKKHPDMIKINYLDQYVNNITFVDGKNGRKCLPVPDVSLLQR